MITPMLNFTMNIFIKFRERVFLIKIYIIYYRITIISVTNSFVLNVFSTQPSEYEEKTFKDRGWGERFAWKSLEED